MHAHPEEPEDEVLVLSQDISIRVARDGIAKQPEAKRPSKDVNVFLQQEMAMVEYNLWLHACTFRVGPRLGGCYYVTSCCLTG